MFDRLKSKKNDKIEDKGENMAKQVFAFLLGIIFTWLSIAGFGGIISRESYREYRDIEKMKTIILNDFYEVVDEESLFEGMKDGMFSTLEDKYSYYLTPEELTALINSNEGMFFGYGLGGIEYTDKHILVGTVMDNSPAKEAGIAPKDRIVSIDGKSVEDIGIEQTKNLLLENNEKGIDIQVLRGEGNEVLDFHIKKREINEGSVFSETHGDILYIKITQFINSTGEDFGKALKENKDAKGLLIDLRNNGGGLLDSVLEVADFILDEGLITYTETKSGERVEYKSDSKEVLNLPVIVLTNENSASASELLAAALKENEVASIYGETTFGKGIVQETYKMPNGSGFKITTRKYFTPLGNDIHKVGVSPNVEIKQDDSISFGTDEDMQLKRAIKDLNEIIK